MQEEVGGAVGGSGSRRKTHHFGKIIGKEDSFQNFDLNTTFWANLSLTQEKKKK